MEIFHTGHSSSWYHVVWIHSKLIGEERSGNIPFCIIFRITVALYQNLRLIKIGETRPPVIPFIDHGGWRQLFLHLLSNIEDVVLFGWPFSVGTSSVHNAHFVIPITNLLYLSRKEFIVIFNNPPVTNLDWLFFCRVSSGLSSDVSTASFVRTKGTQQPSSMAR